MKKEDVTISHRADRRPKTAATRRSGEHRARTQQLSDLAFVVLGCVGAHPEGIHGYSLGSTFPRFVPHLPVPRLGQLYRILHQLEEQGLVTSHIESRSSRLRHRFVITPLGTGRLRTWLTRPGQSGGVRPIGILHRLRFADQLPRTALRRLIDEAALACERELAALWKHADRHASGAASPVGALYGLARARQVTLERQWLEEIRQMVDLSAAGEHDVVGAADELERPRPGSSGL